jgi:uncharacterized protein YdeI (YjbR/CyaY-like superfamily)
MWRSGMPIRRLRTCIESDSPEGRTITPHFKLRSGSAARRVPWERRPRARAFDMKQVHVSTRDHWRRWLAENHEKEEDGIWLVFYKRETGRPSLEYEESVEEALCFGWIDSIIKRLDDQTYCRKFTPRRDGSRWSKANKWRVKKLFKEGRMTGFGLAKVEAAKRSGSWGTDPRPVISIDIPQELSEALGRNRKATAFFERLAPTYRKHFIGWIVTAKRPETRARRVKESMALLARGEKLGLK